MFPRIPTDNPIGLDFETSGLKAWHPDFRALSVAVAHGDNSWSFDATEPNLAKWLTDVLYAARSVAAHNAQFEYQCVRWLGVDPRPVRWFCTMIAACLLDEHLLKYDLFSTAMYFEVDSQKHIWQTRLMDALGVSSLPEAMSRLSTAPRALVHSYMGSDARDTLQLMLIQKPMLWDQELARTMGLEMRVLPVLADMNWHGVRVDLEAAHAAIPALDTRVDELQAEIEKLTGGSFNVNSTPQIRSFFDPEPVGKFQWRLIDGTLVGPTKKGGGPSIGQDVLRDMVHPTAAVILGLRKTIKLRDTFIRGHIIGNADQDGYIHTTFNQTRNDIDAGTVTGRLSSTDPALQQITKRDKANAKILRSMFLPDEGDRWFCADYNQIDYRMAAHLINTPSIIAAYAADPKLDYHQVVSDMTNIPRNPAYAGAPNAKTLNLSLAFGAGAGKIAWSMKMPYTIKEYKGKMAYVAGPEAQAVLEQYHSALPGVRAFSKHAENVAKATGYVKTVLGRRLRFPRGIGVHKAAGLLFQANAADVNKMGIVAVDGTIRRDSLPARLMLSVHDEIDVSMVEDAAMGERINDAFTSPGEELGLRVPVTSDTSFSSNWWGD